MKEKQLFLRTVRSKAGLNQKQMSKAMNMSQSNYCRIETTREPTKIQLRLAEMILILKEKGYDHEDKRYKY